MCDYSLRGVKNRPAKKGDKLVLSRFDNTFTLGTLGFTEVGEPQVAVCLLPGTELKIDNPLKIKLYGLNRLLQRWTDQHLVQVPGGVATFVQINLDKPDRHHDAIKIGERIISLQHIVPGQQASVLQLPAAQKPIKGDSVIAQNDGGTVLQEGNGGAPQFLRQRQRASTETGG